MRTTVIILVALALIAAIAPLTVKLWPRSYMQDAVLLWLNDDEWTHILALAEQTPYTHIIWSEPLTLVGTRTEDGINWHEEPNINELVSTAKDYGFLLIDIQLYSGSWTINGFDDVEVKQSNENEVVHIDSYYQKGLTSAETRCSTELIEAESTGRCYQKVFGGWVRYKEWFTIPHPSLRPQ
ncbi:MULTISPECIES: hypothetical protein [Gammaproteobacteria]|uniref:hypothetical protein n=1 Tax=Gammaproteobacteria TaxID=1236 RepID=UPI000F8077FD|nr:MULTISPECIES: hypothetical protein [Gammaproteobacteria]RTE85490.1 hypothetical protein DQX04_11340 [Aliidiomarina sp. B3213]TCZ89458.1 hypothetical protein EYQ95_11260 [Lysobacter sp. N42]